MGKKAPPILNRIKAIIYKIKIKMLILKIASEQKAEKSRNWTNEEINLFVAFVVDEEYGFAV